MKPSDANPVGILSLQGDFEKHRRALSEIGVPAREVRTAAELSACSALIMPGGESTTMRKLMQSEGLDAALQKFAQSRPIMGTCAGMILLAKEVEDSTVENSEQSRRVEPLGLIDLTVRRNAYGRQINSFVATGRVPLWEDNPQLEMVFIRAPRITAFGSVVVPLATLNDQVVMARSQKILVSAFHPELTADRRVHRFFVEEFIEERKGIPIAL